MELSLLHAGLAAGAALAAIPVILHLFLRQTPKRVVFPALQLIRQRHKRTTKKLRIKNWLLLLARMALVALMALALARPSCTTQKALGDSEVPTALGLVFDTSLSMQYTESGKDRLAEAKVEALKLVDRLADASQVFVVDSAEPGVPAPLSPGAARRRIEALALHAANRPLNAAVGQAYGAVAASDRPRREVYVLTDLARSAWDTNRTVEHLELARNRKAKIATLVLRLSPKEVRDVAIVQAEPVAGIVTEDQPVPVQVKVRSLGPPARRVVEFFVDGRPRDEKKAVELPTNGEKELIFQSPKLKVGTHQGRVQITGGLDPLRFDDVRYFSFRVQPSLKVLIVSDLNLDATFLAHALDPTGTARPFQVDRVLTAHLSTRFNDELKQYACIFLVNVARLDDADWSRLHGYVREGGGLVVSVGDRADLESYNGKVAGQFLPAALKGEPAVPHEQVHFGKADEAHPLFSRYPKELATDLALVPVLRYWPVTPEEKARVLLTYSDGAVALLERVVTGARPGHVLLWTLPLARRPYPKTPQEIREAWTDFPISWSFFYLVNQTVPYLAGRAGERLNVEAGDDVILPIEPGRRYTNFTVQNTEGPDVKSSEFIRLTPPQTSSSLVIEAPQPYGQWTVTATGGPGVDPRTTGFSVNPPLRETELTFLRPADLDALFAGKKGEAYFLADDPDALKQGVEVSRFGQEIFPWLMALVLVLVTVENILANKFYRPA